MSIVVSDPNSWNAPLGGQNRLSGTTNSGGLGYIEFNGIATDIVTAGVTLATAEGGDILIENITFESAGALATGTDVEFTQNGPLGKVILMEVAAPGGASTTDFFTTGIATVGQRAVIQQGNALILKAIGSNFTGVVKWRAAVLFRPCLQSAVLTPLAAYVTNVINPPSPV